MILVGILSILILSIKNRKEREGGGGEGLLNGKNPLSVTKVICRQSLNLHGILVPPVKKGLIRSMFMATLYALQEPIKNKTKMLEAHY